MSFSDEQGDGSDLRRNASRSSLPELISVMSQEFGREPPLYAVRLAARFETAAETLRGVLHVLSPI